MKNYSIGQFANELGVNVQTLRNWDKSGKLKPDYISPAGHRYYSRDQLEEYHGIQVVANASQTKEREAVEDFIQVANIFATRMSEYDSSIVKKLIKELKENN